MFLSRVDEAVAQRRDAHMLLEHGGPNVSQRINLASLYNELARPTEAREILRDFPDRSASPFGMAQVAIERLSSADQLGDKAEAKRWLTYLREHAEDSLSTYQIALLGANDIPQAAKFLIARLGNPDQRLEALMEVQEYAPESIGARAIEMERRRAEMLARPDVQAAIKGVGSVASYSLHRPIS